MTSRKITIFADFSLILSSESCHLLIYKTVMVIKVVWLWVGNVGQRDRFLVRVIVDCNFPRLMLLCINWLFKIIRKGLNMGANEDDGLMIPYCAASIDSSSNLKGNILSWSHFRGAEKWAQLPTGNWCLEAHFKYCCCSFRMISHIFDLLNFCVPTTYAFNVEQRSVSTTFLSHY